MAFSFVQALESRSLLSAGSLDLTYGNGTGLGADVLPVGALVVNDKALQPGDRVLVAGKFTPVGGNAQNFLARYTADGKRDANFAGTSTVLANPRGIDSIDLIATQSDGKILLLDREANVTTGIALVVRLTVSGKVDTSFGKNGVAKIALSTARDLIVAEDGSIVIAGDDGNNLQIAKLAPNGKADTTFAGTGIFSGKLNLTGTNSEDVQFIRTARFITQLPDGKIVLAGSYNLHELNPPSDFAHPFIARLNANGTPDTTFNSDGTLELSSQGNSSTDGFAALSNGKLLIASSTEDTSTLLRLNLDGSTDKKFGFQGAAALDGTSRGIIVQPDGRILVQTPSQFMRYEGDGSLDNGFVDESPGSGESLIGLGSGGSLLSAAVSSEQQSNGPQYTIQPSRRWGEVAPAGLLAAADLTATPTGPYKFSIQWRSETGVNVKTLASNSIQIVGPDGATYKATFLGTTKTGNGAQRTANYKFAAPGGSWDLSDNGAYTVRLLGGVVKDTLSHAASTQTLGLFNVQIP